MKTAIIGLDVTTNMPSPSVARDNFFFATDSRLLYLSDGTAWNLITAPPIVFGTLSARPDATASKGILYYSADESTLDMSDGTTWLPIFS